MNNQIVLIPVNSGISYRSIFQTEIFTNIRKQAKKVIILVPNPSDSFYKKLRKYDNILIEDYKEDEYANYIESSVIQNIFRLSRSFIQNEKYDITTVKGHHKVFINDYRNSNDGFKAKLFLWLISKLVFWGRKIKLVRKAIFLFENLFFTPQIHRDLFNKYKPDLLLVTSAGNFDYDQFFMRQAKKYNTKVISLILSWDNTTTRGYPSAKSDLFITWSDIMKKELIELNDIDKSKIEVGGVAHYDTYFKNDLLYSRDELFSILEIDNKLDLIFFATKSPNCYVSNQYVSQLILNAINNKELIKECQLLVRLHPIYYRMHNSKQIYSNFIRDFEILANENNRMTLNQPKIESKSMNYAMPDDEIKLLSSILKHSSLVVNIFSTLNIEASIFDVPIVNISFEGEMLENFKKARLNIDQDLNETHNQRIVRSGGVNMVYESQKLIPSINEELINPNRRRLGRRKIIKNELGSNHGYAGKQIAKIIMSKF